MDEGDILINGRFGWAVKLRNEQWHLRYDSDHFWVYNEEVSSWLVETDKYRRSGDYGERAVL